MADEFDAAFGDEFDQFSADLDKEKKLAALRAEGTDLSSRIADASAPFDAAESVTGQNTAGDLVGSLFNTARNLYRKPPTARDVGAFGTRAVGAVGGGVAAAAASKNPFAIPAGMTVGEEIAKQGNELVGLEDPSTLGQDVAEFIERGTLNYAIPGQGSVWSKGVLRAPKTAVVDIAGGPVRAVVDKVMGQAPADAAAEAVAQVPGRMMAEMGVAGKQTARELALTQRGAAIEQGVADSGIVDAGANRWNPATLRFEPGGGDVPVQLPDGRIVRSSQLPESASKEAVLGQEIPKIAQQHDQLMADLDWAQSAANVANPAAPIKGITFSELMPEDGMKLFQRLQKWSLTEDQGKAMQSVLDGVKRDIDEVGTGASPNVYRSYMDFLQNAPRGEMTIGQANDLLKNLYFFQRQAKRYDLAVQAKKLAGDSATLSFNQGAGQMIDFLIPKLKQAIQGKGKEIFDTAVADPAFLARLDPEMAKRLSSVNADYAQTLLDRYSNLKDFMPMLQRFNQQGLQEFRPEAPASLLDATKGGMWQSIKSGVIDMFSTPEQRFLKRQANAFEEMRKVQALRSGLLPQNAAPMVMPRTWTGIAADGAKRRALAEILTASGMLPQSAFAQSPDEVLTALPEYERDQVLAGAAQMFPEMFEPTPDGYRSVVNGKFFDPMEKDAHMRATLRANLPAGERARIMTNLMSNNEYTPLADPVRPASRPPLTQDVPDLANFLDVPMSSDGAGTFQMDDAARRFDVMTKSRGLVDAERSGF